MRGAVTAGGRGYVKLGRSEIGASFVSEGSQAGDTKLGGVDARVHLAEGTDARVEFARTDSNNPARAAQADAYFAELKRVSKRVDLNAYYRVQENGFGFGQQSLTETGTRKAALDGRLRLSDRWSLLAEALRQELDATNARRDLVSAEVRRESQTTNLGAVCGMCRSRMPAWGMPAPSKGSSTAASSCWTAGLPCVPNRT